MIFLEYLAKYLMEENVLGFQVAVQDIIVMHILHCVADLLYY